MTIRGWLYAALYFYTPLNEENGLCNREHANYVIARNEGSNPSPFLFYEKERKGVVMIANLFFSACAFFLGRYSYLVMRNRYLENKKAELIAYHAQLLQLSDALEGKDAAMRKKWQSMVDDFSKYQAMINPDTTGKWTDMDDQYLSSWGSAEK